jgi:uncharacterized protein with PQ loop repeat
VRGRIVLLRFFFWKLVKHPFNIKNNGSSDNIGQSSQSATISALAFLSFSRNLFLLLIYHILNKFVQKSLKKSYLLNEKKAKAEIAAYCFNLTQNNLSSPSFFVHIYLKNIVNCVLHFD